MTFPIHGVPFGNVHRREFVWSSMMLPFNSVVQKDEKSLTHVPPDSDKEGEAQRRKGDQTQTMVMRRFIRNLILCVPMAASAVGKATADAVRRDNERKWKEVSDRNGKGGSRWIVVRYCVGQKRKFDASPLSFLPWRRWRPAGNLQTLQILNISWINSSRVYASQSTSSVMIG